MACSDLRSARGAHTSPVQIICVAYLIFGTTTSQLTDLNQADKLPDSLMHIDGAND